MRKYIDAEKLKYEIEKRNLSNYHTTTEGYEEELYAIIDSLQQEQVDMGEVSDGYHTFNELYYYRMLYNAAFFNLLPKWWVHKSKRHHTGEECFGGGWFIVMAELPTGQISNHYELKDWDLFQVPEKEIADEWDGHTPQEAAERIRKYLQQEQPEPTCKTCGFHENNCPFIRGKLIPYPNKVCKDYTYSEVKAQEQQEPFSCGHENGSEPKPEVDLERDAVQFCFDKGLNVTPYQAKTIARHFYELGLNARKEE